MMHCMLVMRELISWSGKEWLRVDERTGSKTESNSLHNTRKAFEREDNVINRIEDNNG